MVSYFLGANTPTGFYSLYDDLLPPEKAKTLYILKGGPGCGKSTCMRRVAKAAQAAGEPVETVLCSGDPDSLDAVLLPRQGVALVDGTAPHVVEPKCPGAVERYVNLGEAYDYQALSGLKEDIRAAKEGYQACYEQAYRALRAVRALRETYRDALLSPELFTKITQQTEKLISREFAVPFHGGGVTRRFLSAFTCQGHLCRWESVEDQCPNVYELVDPYGLAPLLLTPLLAAAVRSGEQVVLCLSPLFPDRPEHLLLPERGLAFVTSTPALPWPGKVKGRIHLEKPVPRALLPRLRFTQRLSEELSEEAVAALARAKAKHDALEAVYHPHVDFGVVDRMADDICAQLHLG